MIQAGFKRHLTVLGFLSLLVSAPDARAQLANSEWPMFHRDPQHTGQGNHVGPINNTLRWTWRGPDKFKNSPSIGPDGTVYVGSGHTLYALDPVTSLDNQREKWSTLVGGSVVYSSPAVGKDYLDTGPICEGCAACPCTRRPVYLGGRDNKLHAFDALNGGPLNNGGHLICDYNVGTDGDVNTAPVIAAPGTYPNTLFVYFGGVRVMHALKQPAVDPNCSVPHTKQLNSPIFTASPALDPTRPDTDGTVYVANLRGYLYALRMTDLSIRWSCQVARHIRLSSPAIGSDGTIYIGTREGLAAVVPSGAINPDGTCPLKWPLLDVGPKGISSTPAISADGYVYVGSKGGGPGTEGALYKVNTADGSIPVPWPKFTGESFRGAPVLGAADGLGRYRIYATTGRRVIAVQDNDAVQVWEKETGGNLYAGLTLAGDGTLYVGSADRNLYAFKSP